MIWWERKAGKLLTLVEVPLFVPDFFFLGGGGGLTRKLKYEIDILIFLPLL